MKRSRRNLDNDSTSNMEPVIVIKNELESVKPLGSNEEYDTDIFNEWIDEPYDDEELDPTYVDEEGSGESDESDDDLVRVTRRIESQNYRKSIENVKFVLRIKNENSDNVEKGLAMESKSPCNANGDLEPNEGQSYSNLHFQKRTVEKDLSNKSPASSTSQEAVVKTLEPSSNFSHSSPKHTSTLKSQHQTAHQNFHRQKRIQYRRKPGKPPARLEELFQIPGLISAAFIPLSRTRGHVEPDRSEAKRKWNSKRQKNECTPNENHGVETLVSVDGWQQLWAVDNIMVFQVLELYTKIEEETELLAARIQLYLPYFRLLNDNLYNDSKEICEISHENVPLYIRIGPFTPERAHVTFLSWNDENKDDSYKCRWKYTPSNRCFTYIIPPGESYCFTGGRTPTVADLFAGAGGFSKAAAEEGCDVVFAVEKDFDAAAAWQKNAIADRRANFAASSGEMFNMRIEDYVERLLAKDIEINNVDILLFGPPCQGFSKANPGGMNDTANRNLVFYIAQTVFLIKPKYVVVENVPGILSAPGKAVIKDLLQLGYAVSYNILLAANFGDPQLRYRVILVASAPGYMHPSQPLVKTTNSSEFKTVQSVLETLSATTHSHTADHYRQLYPNWIYVNDRYLRLCVHPQQPASTLRAAPTDRWRCLRVIRPNPMANAQIRLLTPREVITIQGFSKRFHLQGSYAAQFRQAGNAVPLGLGRAVIKSVIDALNRNPSNSGIPFGSSIEVQGKLPCLDLEDDGREDLDLSQVYTPTHHGNEKECVTIELPSLKDESQLVKDHRERIDHFIVRVPSILVEPAVSPAPEDSETESTFSEEPDTDEVVERFSGNDPNTQEIWCSGTRTWKPKLAFNKRQQKLREYNQAKCEECLKKERKQY